MGSRPQVTVVIATRNSRRQLQRSLPAVLASEGVGVEVVVADAASTDGSAAWLAATHPQVALLRLGRRARPATVIGRGLAASGGEYVALIAAHAVVDPSALRSLLDALAADEAIAIAGATLVDRADPEIVLAHGGGLTWLGIGYDREEGSPAVDLAMAPACEDVAFASPAALMMRRRDWSWVGGCDAALSAGVAEVELGWRVWLLGRRVVVCRDARVHSDGACNEPGRRLHSWQSARGLRDTLRMVATHYPPRFLLRVLWTTARGNLGGRGWRRLALAGAWNAVHLPGTLLRRASLQRRRSTRHEELFRTGIIDGNAHPPVPAQRPARRPPVPFAELIPSDVLLPGHDSAIGRLGAGWNVAERQDGVWLRTTLATSECRLRATSPACDGRLRVHVRAPRGHDGATELTVSCNGAAVAHRWDGDGWQEVSLPVRSAADGRLGVSLRTQDRNASDRAAQGGRRPAGCAVREVRFVPSAPAPAPPPRSISVIIPTYNRWPILAETLAALAAQTMRDFEIVVVDDGSTDDTWERLAVWRRDHPDVSLTPIRQPNLKPGRARNRALADAGGDLVLFLGDDIIPDRELLAQHLATHRGVGETIGVLGFTEWDRARMPVTPFLDFVNRDGQQFAYDHFQDGADIFFTGFYTSNISLPRWTLGEEPFHTAFTFVDWEDIELGYRLSLRGLRLIYNSRARATHVHPMGIRQFYRRQEHVGRTIDVILDLHPELAVSERMPPLDPYPRFPWYRWARLAVPPLLPLLDRWDRGGRRLPAWLYRNVLLCAFWSGCRDVLSSRP